MNFGFSEEQEMIRKSARDLVKGQSSFERIRGHANDEKGFSEDIWRQMAEQGWLGTVLPDSYGGVGLGYVDLLCIQEELGKGVMPEPILSSGVLGAGAIFHGGSEAQKQELLPQIASGELIATLGAYELAGRYDFAHVETHADGNGGGYKLTGEKAFVPDAHVAGKIIVSARTSGGKNDKEGISLFLVDAKGPGVNLKPVKTIDRRRRFTLELKDAKAEPLGEIGAGYAALDATIDRATVALCAEMLGGMEAALQMSVAYSKERVQFGRPIGSFQAIKHKAANMYVALETARSATYYATMAVDENMPDMRPAISCAKALCSDSYLKIGKDAIQIHGGIGFTDECDVQFFYKRAVVASVTFGDASYHRDRYAAEKGF